MSLPTLPNLHCPCGSPAAYARCCGRLHDGDATARTAEELMRSRYTAFAMGDAPYLLRTWHPDTRPAVLDLLDNPRWTGLRIIRTVAGQPGDDTGQVEFEATYVRDGGRGAQHEVSRFRRVAGEWRYVGED